MKVELIYLISRFQLAIFKALFSERLKTHGNTQNKRKTNYLQQNWNVITKIL